MSLFHVSFAQEKNTVIPAVKSRAKIFVKNKNNFAIQTTHISREEIKTSPVTNLSELLQQEQSIVRLTNNSIDSSQTALSIRGFGENAAANSLILIDGFPLINASLLAPNLNAIALSDIERIDIIQGSQGSLWGDQAVGGVLNIVTRHPEHFIGNLSGGWGSFHQQFYNALAGSKFASGFFFKAFGFTNQTHNFRQHNNQKNETLFLQIGMDYAQGMININLQTIESNVFLPGGLTQSQFDENAKQAVNFTNFNHYKTQIFQLLHKQELTTSWVLETRLSHQNIDGDGVLTIAYNQNEKVNMFNPQLKGFIHGNKIIFGYLWESSSYHIWHVLFNKRVNAYQNNVYTQLTTPLFKTMDIILGARIASQHNNVENTVQPINSYRPVFVSEQGLSYHPSNQWQFFIRRDGNFRFPKANETTWTPSNNETLQVQTGVSYEAGTTFVTKKQKMQLSLYRLQLHNEIAFDPTKTIFQPMGSFRNFPQTLRKGVTLTELYNLTPTIALNAQLNYVNARFASGIFSGKAIPAVPFFNGNLGVHYKFIENWQVYYTGLYTGASFASVDDANAGRKQPGYWLHTFALQYITPSINVNFEIANFLNKTYASYVVFHAASHSYLYYPGAGRSFLLTIKTSIN